MGEYIELGYIAAIIIGVSTWVVHITARRKQLPTNSRMTKQNSTTVFLGLVLLFNICDFMTVFMANIIKEEGVQWIYVFENVLEVALIYVIIEMEREMARAPKSRWMDVAFAVVGTCILFGDSMHSFGTIYQSEASYLGMMILLNTIPILFLLGFGFEYWKVFYQTETRKNSTAMFLYNIICVLMCCTATATIADARTSYDFFIDDDLFYIIFWLIFNTTNFIYTWQACLPSAPESAETKISEEERLDGIFELYALSEREREIAQHLNCGRNNKEIAAIMCLSPNTVKVHASNLYRKLGVTNRVQAVRVLNGEAPAEENEIAQDNEKAAEK